MLTRTEGIVLRTQKYGEADLIATYLTADRGIIRAFAKSPRKTKSRFGSSLEPLTHARISLWGKEQASMPRLTQSDIINPFNQIRENYDDFINVSKLTEMLISLTPAESPNKRLFSFFLSTLQFIRSCSEGPKDALHMIARIRLLAAAGYAPRLNGCGRCGGSSLEFYPDSGTTLCGKCAADRVGETGRPFMRISGRAAHFYTHSMKWPINISNRLRPDRQTIDELSLVIDRHLGHLLSKRLLSSDFPPGTGGAGAPYI